MRCFAGENVDGDDAKDARSRSAEKVVLNRGGLQHANKSAAIGRDGEAFHAFIGRSAAEVAGNFGGTSRSKIVHEEVVGELERADALAAETQELIDVRAVFVRDENGEAVV